MPELPEVETVVRGLSKTIVGHQISKITIKNTARIFPGRAKFKARLSNTKIKSINRRAKNILINLSNDYTLWVHLKMTGYFYYRPASTPIDKHDHVVFDFTKNNYNLRFNDYRRFGYLKLFPTDEIYNQPGLADLGPEPLDLSAEDFLSMCQSRSRMIKPALLDQTFIAGIGNIYADESLYLSRIHPQRLTNSLSSKKLTELHGHIQSVLKQAIKLMGTSVDTFAGVNGQPGRYQKYLRAYGREDEPCFRCGRKIRREKIGSRSAHFCPSCQRISR
ncbi:MAG: bifunctional DNA-formamidopyrimidine glycosylase/DNA-(apurinic or apyrimidinic site) lyase [candidate division Zixibacteria bacterium]